MQGIQPLWECGTIRVMIHLKAGRRNVTNMVVRGGDAAGQQ